MRTLWLQLTWLQNTTLSIATEQATAPDDDEMLNSLLPSLLHHSHSIRIDDETPSTACSLYSRGISMVHSPLSAETGLDLRRAARHLNGPRLLVCRFVDEAKDRTLPANSQDRREKEEWGEAPMRQGEEDKVDERIRKQRREDRDLFQTKQEHTQKELKISISGTTHM